MVRGPTSRRHFLRQSSLYSLGFLALRRCVQTASAAGAEALAPRPDLGYGPLVADPEELLDLPRGFAYKIVSRAGDAMDDGLFVPGKADGMATFAGPDGLAIIVRNHELLPYEGPSPFGQSNRLPDSIDPGRLYDAGRGRSPHRGGTTTLLFDPREQRVVKQFMSLAGTARNCAGGPTPWNSWISCEETVVVAGRGKDGDYVSDKDHGYCFDVPATADIRLADPIPLAAMGRFNHEAVAVDPRTGIVYETEDREDGLFFRFLPAKPGELKAGGQLQALCVVGFAPKDTRNWGPHEPIDQGAKLRVRWIDMDQVEAPEDALRYRGFDAGAARFARGEGIWYADGAFYIACTNGGPKQKGQIWKYTPAEREGAGGDDDSGTLELFVESRDSALLESCDNLTMSPWGDLVVCEDRDGKVVRLVGVTPDGQMYTLANSHAKSEFAGVAFTPDGTTLLVNIQHRGLTIAVTGPWRRLA
ncbi:MAG TPA: alkaline phosphatase PhoX [Lacipirellulaceae bacterium]|nr:alkaline phosphatase PhoX [Lacipirellulaceae bacterium]